MKLDDEIVNFLSLPSSIEIERFLQWSIVPLILILPKLILLECIDFSINVFSTFKCA